MILSTNFLKDYLDIKSFISKLSNKMLRKINKIVNDENFQFLSFIGIFSTLGIYLTYKLFLFIRSSKLKKIEINLS